MEQKLDKQNQWTYIIEVEQDFGRGPSAALTMLNFQSHLKCVALRISASVCVSGGKLSLQLKLGYSQVPHSTKCCSGILVNLLSINNPKAGQLNVG